jgi:hypothetical protein
MNLVGKIFIVLIFVMSLVFASLAVGVYATQRNWKAEAESVAQKYTNARNENSELSKKKKEGEEEAAIEKARSEKVVAQLETENQELKKERAANEKKIAELDESVRSAVASMKVAHETLAVLRKETDTMRDEIKTAQGERDATFKKIVDLTDQVHNVVNERLRLEKVGRELADQLAKARECLRYYKLNENGDYKSKEPPTGLEGQVTGAPRPDLVEISIGADEGLLKGHRLEVVRLNGSTASYVGRIEVIETSPNRAVCRTEPKMLRSPIESGDRVYANLSQVR